jgi:hypothetical protein
MRVAKDARQTVAPHALHLLTGVRGITQRVLFSLAVEAFPASDDGKDDHSIASVKCCDFWTDIFDDTDGLMAHDIAFLHGRVQFANIHVEIRSADGAVSDSDDSIFACGNHGFGNNADFDLLGSQPLGCFHGIIRMRLVVSSNDISLIRSMFCLYYIITGIGTYLEATSGMMIDILL